LKILKGDGSWAQNAVVLANAAMALHCTGNYKTYDDAFNAAIESLESGKAKKSLDKLIQFAAMNILEEIIEYKREEVKTKKSKVKTADLEKRELFSRAVLPLKEFLLDRSRTGIIAEFKRRSPSKGIINPDVDVYRGNKRFYKEWRFLFVCVD
jgi:hypothetical protein